MSGLLTKTKSVKSAILPLLPAFVQNWIRRRRARRREESARRRFAESLRPSDVFLVGHPKSGNTWLAYMLAILVHGDREKRINIANIGRYVPTMHARDHIIDRFADMQGPRIFRNEGPVYPELYPRTIYIVRDPRSVLLSYYHHCVHDTGRSDWLIEDFVDEMLREGCIRELEAFLVRWDRQLEGWAKRSQQQPVKMVRYEDLKADRKSVLRELADFIGLDCSEEVLSEAVVRGDFNSMRGEEKSHGAESYAGEKGAKGFFVRKGKTDSWKEEMSPDTIVKIEQAFAAGMKKLGYLD